MTLMFGRLIKDSGLAIFPFDGLDEVSSRCCCGSLSFPEARTDGRMVFTQAAAKAVEAAQA